MGWSKAAAADPVLFLKPCTAYVVEGNPIKIPYGCNDLHHEVELGVIIGRKGVDVPVSEAMDYVGGYTVCLDMTARDLQAKAKAEGKPWSIAKGFDTSCPVGTFIPKEQIADPHALRIWCEVNGKMRQDGNTKDMIRKIPDLIHMISRTFTLEPGDLILTGTPAGVGTLSAGDEIRAGLADLISMKFSVARRE
jgi:acylpyruvate hydrolase